MAIGRVVAVLEDSFVMLKGDAVLPASGSVLVVISDRIDEKLQRRTFFHQG